MSEHRVRGVVGLVVACLAWVCASVPAQESGARALLKRAIARQNTGAHDEAVALFTKALAADPGLVAARKGRAESNLARFEHEAVRTDVRAIRTREPDHVGASVLEVRLHHEMLALEEARSAFAALCDRFPEDPRPHAWHALVLVDLARFAEARAAAERAVTRGKRDGRAWTALGRAKRATGDLAGAIEAFDRAVELSPPWKRPYLSRATAYEMSGRHDAAARDLTTAIASGPDPSLAHADRAALRHLRFAEPSAVEADVSAAMKSELRRPIELVNRAVSVAEAGRTTEAKKDCEALLRLAPDAATTHETRAFVFLVASEYAAAEAAGARALALQPDHVDTLETMAEIAAYRGDFSAAVRRLDRVLEKRPAHYLALVRRAWHKWAGQLEGVEDDLTAAMRLAPDRPDAYRQRALFSEVKGDHDAALRDLARAIELRPHDALAYALRSAIRKQCRDEKGAAADLEAIGAERRYASQRMGDLSKVIGGLGRVGAARRFVEYAVHVDPTSGDAIELRAAVLSHEGEAAGALRDAERAVELRPKAASARVTRARILLHANRLEDAAKDVAFALEAEPKNAEALGLRASLRFAKGDHAAGLSDLTRAIEIEPKNPNLLQHRAYRRAAAKDLKGAIADITRAIELIPDNLTPYCVRAGWYVEQGDEKRAARDVAHVLASAKVDPQSLLGCCRVLADLRRLEEALGVADRILKRNPDHAEALELRGWIYHESGDPDLALADLNRAIRLVPKAPYARKLRASILAGKGQYDRVIEDMTALLKVKPKDAGAFAQRAYAHMMKRDWEEALADYDACIRIDPEDSTAYKHRGWIYLQEESHEEALEDLNRAIALNPHDMNAYGYRAMVKAALGDGTGAAADRAKYEELYRRTKPGH